MRKILGLLLAVMMVLSITSCGGGDGETESGNAQETQQTQQPDGTPSAEESAVEAPLSPSAPAPLVHTKVEGFTQEQVSEVYKFIHFVTGLTYEEIDELIPEEGFFMSYWVELENYSVNGVDPYEALGLYDNADDSSADSQSDMILTLYCYDTDQHIALKMNPEHVFMEPVMLETTDSNINWFYYVDGNHSLYEFQVGLLNDLTDAFDEKFAAQYDMLKSCDVTDVVEFQAGGMTWERSNNIYEVTIEGGKESEGEIFESTRYDCLCSAQLKNNMYIWINVPTSTDPEIGTFCEKLLTDCIISYSIQ